MKLEPLTPKKRAQIDERTRGQDIIAMGALVAGGAIFVLLSGATPRAYGFALAIPFAAMTFLTFRTANAYGQLGMRHRRERFLISAVALALLTIAVVVAQEVFLRMQPAA